jgi:tryptophan synthase alpha chain
MNGLHAAFAAAHDEGRAALIGYLPAGYPSVPAAVDCLTEMVAGGVDVVEVGLPYSDPVMDGPTIQAAVDTALRGGTTTRDVLATVHAVASMGTPALVMSYWNPIERFGIDSFAAALQQAGGVGVITPDLTPEESDGWVSATQASGIDRVFLVALSSTDERIARVCAVTSGFVYAGAVMGVTGARATLSDSVAGLVGRVRQATDLPIAVGLGVSTPEQASQVAQYADGVIVGSAFVNAIREGGPAAAGRLARTLAQGVRRG